MINKHIIILKNLAKLVTLIILYLQIGGCEDDKESNNSQLFVNFSHSSENFILNETTNYKDYPYTRIGSDGKLFSYRGSLADDSQTLEHYFNRPKNYFSISFYNISLEEIDTGTYSYISEVNEASSGVDITWMNTNEWEKVLEYYRTTEAYEECMDRLQNAKYCEGQTISFSDFYSTMNVDNTDSYIDITKKSYEIFPIDVCRDSNYKSIDLVIEGEFNCKTSSVLYPEYIIPISGSFRIHIPVLVDCI